MTEHSVIKPSSNFNSLFLLSETHHLDEDTRGMMLQAEYLGTKQQLLEEYGQTVTESSLIQHNSYDENIKLKKELDKIKAHNYALTNKLQNQKNLAETLEKQISAPKSTAYKQSRIAPSSLYSSRTSLLGCSKHEISNYGEEILKKIEKIELTQAEEEAVAESLRNMQLKLKQSSLIWKERLNQALKMHNSVLINHDKLSTAKTLAINNFLTTQKEVKTFKTLVQKDKLTYRSEYTRHQNIKQEEERRIDSLIHKISSSNLDIQRKNQSKDNLLNALSERITQLEEDKHFRSSLFKKLNKYRQNIKIIEKVMAGINIQIDIQEPFREISTQTLINTIKDFKYQEDSLSIRFQQLTTEYSVKQKQCDFIQSELNVLKESNIPLNEDRLYRHETYNNIRSSLDTVKELQNKQDLASKYEKVCIKLYLQILNISSVLCTAVSNIHENSIDNSTELISAHALLKQLTDMFNKGFASKKSDESRKDFSKLAQQSISSVFQTEVVDLQLTSDLSKGEFKDSLACFSLSYGEIKDAYVQVLGDRSTATNFARLLKEVNSI